MQCRYTPIYVEEFQGRYFVFTLRIQHVLYIISILHMVILTGPCTSITESIVGDGKYGSQGPERNEEIEGPTEEHIP